MKKKIESSKVLNVLAVCCGLYGVLVFLSRTGTAFFLIWFAIGFVLLGAAYVVKKGLWKEIPLYLRKAIVILLCICFLWFLVVECIILSGFGRKGEDNLDYIVVLGAQVYENGPSDILRRRLKKAVAYLDDNPDTICVVTGGQGYNEPFPEAEGMKEYLLENGINPARILVEPKSESTEENLTFAGKLIPMDSNIGVVTNNFHVYRAVQTARAAGFENVCGISSSSSIMYLPNNMLREFLALNKFWLFK